MTDSRTSAHPTQLGMIGLGRMGASMVRRLMADGHDCVVYDLSPPFVDALVADGATGSSDLAGFVGALAAPRSVWIMVPAAFVDDTIGKLTELLEPGDTIIDGGNSHYHDDIRRAPESRPGSRIRDLDLTVARAEPAEQPEEPTEESPRGGLVRTVVEWAMVLGTAAAPVTKLIADDNRVPNVASRAKVRIVNGLSTSATVAGYVTGASNSSTKDAASGAASDYVSVLASGTTSVQGLSSDAFDPIFSQTVTVSGTSLLAAQGVYSIFILDGQVTNGTAVPVGRLVKDR